VGAAAPVSLRDALLSSRQRIDDLWRECVARLDDDEPRHILADALQAEDDPRGELMMLQLMPADPDSAPARRERIRELVKRWRGPWLGRLDNIARGASWERGFLTRLEESDHENDAWTQPGSYDRELSTLQEVIPSTWKHTSSGRELREYTSLITDPRMVSLRSIGAHLGLLSRLTQPLRHVALDNSAVTNPSQLRAVFAYIAAHDDVTSLALPLAVFAEAEREPWFPRLRAVTLGTTMRRGLDYAARIPTGASLVLCSRVELDTCELRSPHDARLELTPSHVARVSGEWLLQPLDVLATLPARFTHLEIEDTSEPIIDRIRQVVEPRGIELSLRGLIGRAGNIRWR
jgi:hypothetical protein